MIPLHSNSGLVGRWRRILSLSLMGLAVATGFLIHSHERQKRVHAEEKYNETIVPALTAKTSEGV